MSLEGHRQLKVLTHYSECLMYLNKTIRRPRLSGSTGISVSLKKKKPEAYAGMRPFRATDNSKATREKCDPKPLWQCGVRITCAHRFSSVSSVRTSM